MVTVYVPGKAPIKNQAFTLVIPGLVSQSDPDIFQVNPTLAAGDTKHYGDGSLNGNTTNAASAVDASGAAVTLTLTAAEMDYDEVIIWFVDASGDEWQDLGILIYTVAATTVSDFDESTDSVNVTTIEGSDATDQINAACDIALSDYDPPTKAELDTGLAALNDPTAAAIADAVWDEAIADHTSTGSTGEKLNAITDTAITVSSLVDGEDITFIIGATYDETQSGFTISSNWKYVLFSAKRKKTDDDNDALVRVLVTNPADSNEDGLVRLQRATVADANRGRGALTVNQSAGTIALELKPNATTELEEGDGLYYDYKEILDDDVDDPTENIIAEGDLTIQHTATHATSV